VPFVNVNGLRIAYERRGSGPPLVLLHGYVGDGLATWLPQIDGLSDMFTVVAWDAPGAGRSADPPEDFGIDGYASCLAEFLARLGLGRAIVAGLSFGGIVALGLQRRHSDQCRALVLASAYAGWAGSLPTQLADQRLRQALELADASPAAFSSVLLPTMFRRPMAAETIDAFRLSLEAFHPQGFRAMARASAENLRDVLPRVVVPTLLVYGDADIRAARSVRDDLHASIAGSRLVVLPGAGHVCNLEFPDEFNAAVREFVRELRD
jgi:pimeloyl-ACP methyl ester carboxylesterase